MNLKTTQYCKWLVFVPIVQNSLLAVLEDHGTNSISSIVAIILIVAKFG